MNANKRLVENLVYKELSYQIVGCFYKVYNELGPGFKELIYHRALAIELETQNIPYEEEKKIAIQYKGKNMGYYTPDFVINRKVIIEIKAIDSMPKFYEKQLYYYLKGTDYKLGYIVNFGSEKLDMRRRVYERARKMKPPRCKQRGIRIQIFHNRSKLRGINPWRIKFPISGN